MRTLLSASTVWMLLASVVPAADTPAASFTKKPTAERVGDKVRIEFAVDRATDVAVFIEDGSGKAVRHLVAGVLGKNPPAPLKADSLAQTVVWDGKFDKSIVAAGLKPSGPFKVRVAIGTRPAFDGYLLHNRAATGRVVALATGPKGEVYLFHRDPTSNGNMGGNKLKVIDRDGKPLRVLMPMSADLPADRLKALGVFRTDSGQLVPRLHNYEQLSFYPDPLGSRGRSMPGYASPTVDRRGRVYWLMLGVRLACLDADGGVPYPTFYGEPLLGDLEGLRLTNQYAHGFERPSLAVSGDGKWIYFAGLQRGKGAKDGKAVPAVFRVNLATRAKAEVFLGDVQTPGKDGKSLAGPRGLAVAKGLLYVADFDNNRIMVFKESDRSLAGKVAVTKPDTLGVDPKTGAIYVCCWTSKVTGDLVKIDNYTSGKELYRMKLPRAGGNPWDFEHRIAVDASAKPVLVWLSGLSYSRHQLMRIEDLGDKFGPVVDPRDLKTPWAEGPRDMNVDRVRDELFVKANPEQWYRLNEKTGELIARLRPGRPRLGSSANGTQLVPGPDGNLYTWSWSAGFHVFDRAGKSINLPGREVKNLPLGGIMCFQERHLELLSPTEWLIVLNPQWFYEKYPKAPTPIQILFGEDAKLKRGKASLLTSIGVIGPDGRLKRTVIWQCLPGATPRVDEQGNIYLAEIVKPAGRSYPAFFDGKLKPPGKTARRASGARFWSSYVSGSIIKFPPSGGAVWFEPKLPPGVKGEPPAELKAKPKVKVRVHRGYKPESAAEVQGAEWVRFGFAPYSCWSTRSTDTCMCEGSRFDVDAFGRVFYPNLLQFRVEVVDTNNNRLTTFGRYGNEDFDAKAKGGIPLAWPTAVAVSDTHVYIGDTLNRRVVRVRLGTAAEETADLPATASTRP